MHGLPTVHADPILLGQVLVNVIDNALKYTRNVESPRVTIGIELARGEEPIFVRDNGIGFDPRMPETASASFTACTAQKISKAPPSGSH